jgi:hypothetical protein
MRSFYQGRLGTNIGKSTQKQTIVFFSQARDQLTSVYTAFLRAVPGLADVPELGGADGCGKLASAILVRNKTAPLVLLEPF